MRVRQRLLPGIGKKMTRSPGVRPEIELLACCGRTQVADAASRIAALLREEIDWTYLVRIALAHGMSPFLARAFEYRSRARRWLPLAAAALLAALGLIGWALR